jgi:uncharacterized protein YdcH (DUF465 family)
MADLLKRYNFLVKEHNRLHAQVNYIENDHVSNRALTEAKKRKLKIKQELYELKKKLGISDES